jgi:hypothetical protein
VKLSRRTVLGAGFASALGPLAGCSGDWEIIGKKVLFVGNSFTDYNGGLDAMLKTLAPRTEASRIAPGGSTLQQHAANKDDAAALRSGWDYVVLQDQSQYPIVEPATFRAGATTMVAKVRAAKATPLFLATWGRPDSPGVTSAALDEAYRALGELLGVTVIPAGKSFEQSLKVRPSFPLTEHDGHPTKAGTYLAACTAMAMIYRTTPVGNSAHAGFTDEIARHLQRSASTATGF